MLDTLKEFSSQRRAYHLAKASRALRPDPGLGEKGANLSTDVDYDAVLNEVAEAIGQDDLSSEDARREAIAYINHEVHKWALKGKDINAIRGRLGQRGDLDNRLYRVEVGGFAKKIMPQFGITPRHAKDAVRNPDQVQHLMTAGENAEMAVSLFLQHDPVKQSDRFSLLVQVFREGRSLKVHVAWRLYHSDIDAEVTDSPVEWLQAFAEAYGASFRAPVARGRRLILDENIQLGNLRNWGEAHIANELDLEASTDAVQLVAAGRPLGDGEHHVAVIYAIEEERYLRDLRDRHGVINYK